MMSEYGYMYGRFGTLAKVMSSALWVFLLSRANSGLVCQVTFEKNHRQVYGKVTHTLFSLFANLICLVSEISSTVAPCLSPTLFFVSYINIYDIADIPGD